MNKSNSIKSSRIDEKVDIKAINKKGTERTVKGVIFFS